MHIKDESEQKCAALWFRNVAYKGSRHHSPWKKWKHDGHIYMITLTHFWPMFLFYTPWRHQKPKVSGVFRGYKMGTLAQNRLINTENLYVVSSSSSCPKQPAKNCLCYFKMYHAISGNLGSKIIPRFTKAHKFPLLNSFMKEVLII